MAVKHSIISALDTFKSKHEARVEAAKALYKALGADYDKHHVLLNRRYWEGIEAWHLPSGIMLTKWTPRDVSHIIVMRDYDAKQSSKHIKIDETQEV